MNVLNALEHIFKASLEREIPGTLGKIFIFHNAPGTQPERFAVKTVEPGRLTNGTTYEALRRFGHEIRHWIRYRHHPLIVTPFFTSFVERWPYVAMPYCEGTLKDCIVGMIPGFGRSEAVASIIQVLEALDYAASRGLLAHQDLKPENILLQDLGKRFDLPSDYPFNWRPRLADFGLANAYTELQIPWGSRPYLAPEQYERDQDLRGVDVFACAVILHELLTGLHPIGKATHLIWPKPVSGESTQWSHEKKWKQWARSTPKLSIDKQRALGPCGDVIARALDADPFNRPSVAEFKDELLNSLSQSEHHSHENLLLLLDHYQQICAESEASGDNDARYQQRYIDILTHQQLQ